MKLPYSCSCLLYTSQGGTARDVQAGQFVAEAFKRCQGGTGRDIQAGQFVAVAVKLFQGGTARDIQAGQLIVVAVSYTHLDVYKRQA